MMQNIIQDHPTPEDRTLFLDINAHIRSNPDEYRTAGKWLDEYCSPAAYVARLENERNELHKRKPRIGPERYKHCIRELNKRIREKYIPDIHILLSDAISCLLSETHNFLPIEYARKVLLITWLLTDPDAEKTKLDITSLEKKTVWDDQQEIADRRYISDLMLCGRYEEWINLVRKAWKVIKADTELKNTGKSGSESVLHWKIPDTKKKILREIKIEMGHTGVLAVAIDNVLKKYPNFDFPSVRAIRQAYTRMNIPKKR